MWALIGVMVLIGVIVGGIIWAKSNGAHAAATQGAVATSTASHAATSSQYMYVQGSRVVAGSSTFALVPISQLVNPGSFAAKGTLTHIIPDPATKSHTPYYFVLQQNGSVVVVGIVVPAGDSKKFTTSTFATGDTVLAAGTIFPFSNQAGVFNYGEFVQSLHPIPGLQRLQLPASTPVLTVNYKNIEVVK